MNKRTLKFKPGSLLSHIEATSEQAEAQGALHHIATETVLVEDGGITFLVRVLRNLRKKIEAGLDQRKKTEDTGQYHNPFLPYEEILHVADVTDTHVIILNKFPVLDYHTLLITRAFEEQQSLLTPADFTALWGCMAEYDALAFYNGGRDAGSSQRHKHLQIIPLPLHDTGPKLPIGPLFEHAKMTSELGTLPDLPVKHTVAKINPAWLQNPETAGQDCYELFCKMLAQVDISETSILADPPYNFIATREWMLLLPRLTSHYEHIYINSLGFAGALLVRDDEHLAHLIKTRPSKVLQHVSFPAENT